VNGDQLTQDHREAELSDGDVLKFGAYQDSFRVQWEPFIIGADEGGILLDKAAAVGVSITHDWHELVKCFVLADTENHKFNPFYLKCLMSGVPLVSLSDLDPVWAVSSGSTKIPEFKRNGNISKIFQDFSLLQNPSIPDWLIDLFTLGGGQILDLVREEESSRILLSLEKIPKINLKYKIINIQNLLNSILTQNPSVLDNIRDTEPGITLLLQPSNDWLSKPQASPNEESATVESMRVDIRTMTPFSRIKRNRVNVEISKTIKLIEWDSNNPKRLKREGLLDTSTQLDDQWL
jgi:hypothetical protein